MKDILLPFDFSSGSLNALNYALDLADSLKSQITLLHVFDTERSAKSEPAYFRSALQDGDIPKAEKELKIFADAIQDELGLFIPMEYKVIEGKPLEVITAYANKYYPDLILMSTWWAKGVDNLFHSFTGNMGTKLIKKCKTPVLLVPENVSFSGVEHIVYATNFKEKDQRIPKELLELRNDYSMDISVVHVYRSGSFYGPIEFDFLNKMYQLEKGNINIFFYTIHHEKVIKGLNQFVQKEKADMLAMLVHENMNIIDRLFGPDIPKQMAFHSIVPILFLHD